MHSYCECTIKYQCKSQRKALLFTCDKMALTCRSVRSSATAISYLRSRVKQFECPNSASNSRICSLVKAVRSLRGLGSGLWVSAAQRLMLLCRATVHTATPCCTVLDKLIAAQFKTFWNAKTLPCLQEPTIASCSEPIVSGPRLQSLSLRYISTFSFYTLASVSQVRSSLQCSRKKIFVHFSSFPFMPYIKTVSHCFIVLTI